MAEIDETEEKNAEPSDGQIRHNYIILIPPDVYYYGMCVRAAMDVPLEQVINQNISASILS